MKSNQLINRGPDRRFVLGIIVAFSLVLVGCVCTPTNSLAQNIYSGPVIDIHTHLFNIKDLPVNGIICAQAKQKVSTALASAITDRVKEVADLPRDREGNLLNANDQPQIMKGTPSPETQAVNAEWQLIQEFARPSGTEKALLPLPPSLTRSPDELTPRDKEELLVENLVKAGFLEQELESLSADPTNKGFFSELEGTKGSLRWFLRLMFKSNSAQATQLMRKDFPGVDLFVHHMMDLDLAYAGITCHGFEDQEHEMQQLDTDYPGKLLHFVAFDPFRRTNALPIMKEGLTNGAVGVKFYPPSGYRASGNVIPDRPLWPGPALEQWKSRYGSLTNGGAELNAYCEEMFAYCETNDIPIMTHCSPQGFQAAEGYGTNSSPDYWRPVLEKHRNLRLCFAHSGGKTWWFTNTTNVPSTNTIEFIQWSFATNIAALCLEYTNVFCDTAYLEAALKPENLSMFSARLTSVITNSAPGCSWKFGDKVMYGSDWHLLSQEQGFRNYLADFKQVFASPKLVPWQRAFFTSNAIRYLGLRNLKQARFAHLSSTQQKQLDALVKHCDAP